MKRSLKISALLLLMSVQYGCNIFDGEVNIPNLSVNVAPTSVAGSVLTSGQGSENGDVQLTAIANTNWSFSHWSGDVESDENPLFLSLNQNTEVFANFVLSGNEGSIALRITDGQFVSELNFGQVEGATDGFDSGIDLEAPPPPPQGVLYAWFGSDSRRLLRDYRNPFTSEVEWRLEINPGSSENITIEWMLGEENTDTLFLVDENGEVLSNLSDSNELAVVMSEFTPFTIRNSMP